MLEQGGYPYIEGSKGINFRGVRIKAQSLSDSEKGLTIESKDAQKLVTGSGRPVIGRFTPTSIQITDVEDQFWAMNAFLDNLGELAFGIRTRNTSGKLIQPDFFASKFVTFALRNLQSSAGPINFIRGVWHRESKNFQMFIDTLDRTGDIVEAARSTWTGRVARANGFDVQGNNQVVIDDRNEDTAIRVLFARNGIGVSTST